MKNGLLKLIHGVAFVFFCQSSMAGLLDFTDSSLIGSLTTVTNGYSGTYNGIGFTLTSTNGAVNFEQGYDGSAQIGCQSGGGVLKCDQDGAGIHPLHHGKDDEITGGSQTLTLTFDQVVKISGFHFLDLYVNPDGKGSKEQATIILDGAFFKTVDATATVGDGGYANLIIGPILAQTLEFSANPYYIFWDDHNNDYALAGVDVSAVPLPPAVWLFGSAIAGLIGFRRRA